MDSLRDRIVTALWESWQPTEPSIESMADAVIEALGLREENRSLPDGMGGVSINYKTGERTNHFQPCTRQTRYVTEWEIHD